MNKRVIIIDPGFEHQDSHHMVVNTQICSAFNHEKIIIASGKSLSQKISIPNAKIIPFFDINLYPVNYHDLPRKEYHEINKKFEFKIKELFSTIEARDNDCFIIHTAFSFLYESFARALLKNKIDNCSIYISTMFSPGRTIEFGDSTTNSIREFMRHKFAFSLFEKLSRERNINIYVDSPTQMYVDAYQTIWRNSEVKLHPSVCGGGTVSSKPEKNRVLTYLGGPKWDKGIEFTVNAICKLSEISPDTEYLFHFNDEFPGSDAYLPLIEKLELNPNKNITIIKGNLDKEKYESLLETSYTFLMLYDPKDYAYKTSGVLWDVLRHAEGKKIVVSKGTWHEKELTLIGATYASVEYGNSEQLAKLLNDNNFQPISPRLYNSRYLQILLSNFGQHVKSRLDSNEGTRQTLRVEPKKKILVVRTDYGHFTKLSGPGGFVDYLPDNGFEVREVLVPLGHEKAKFESDGKRWEVLENFGKILKSYQVNSFDIENEILSEYMNYDVIHFVDGEHCGLLTALAKISGLLDNGPKLVATFHQPDFVMEDLVPEPDFLNAFDTIHLMSPCQKEAFIRLGVAEQKLVVVPHGVSEEHYKPSIALELAGPAKNEIESIQNRLNGKKVCLTVGNWLRDYNTFLEVAREFRDRDDVYFVALSRGLELNLTEDDRNILLFNEGLEDRTLHWFYRRAELMFLPLKGGAANNAILEACASGIPIITTRLPSTEFYSNNKAVLCTSINNFTSEIDAYLSENEAVEALHTNRQLNWKLVALEMNNKLYK